MTTRTHLLENIHLRPYDSRDFEDSWRLLSDAFPPHELVPKERMRARLVKKYCAPVLAVIPPEIATSGKEEILAVMVIWHLPTCSYGDYIAVHSSCRNLGLGSWLMGQILRKAEAGGRAFIFEIEMPETETARRRLDFYCRNGFEVVPTDYAMPALRPSDHPVPMMIMQGGHVLRLEEIEDIIQFLYDYVYSESIDFENNAAL